MKTVLIIGAAVLAVAAVVLLLAGVLAVATASAIMKEFTD